jgi:DNA-directed RNA polymerase subunit RPC12/RpoP
MAEIIACPNCQRQLQIEEAIFGDVVQCPKCAYRFMVTAAMKTALTPAEPLPAAAKPPRKADWNPAHDRWVEDDQDDFDIRGPRQRRFDDDDDDDWPRRRRHPEPHRANIILLLAILSVAVAPIIVGSIAWILGRADLRAMDEGRMDPSGRPMTQAGAMLGLVLAILHLIAIFAFVWYLFLVGGF